MTSLIFRPIIFLIRKIINNIIIVDIYIAQISCECVEMDETTDNILKNLIWQEAGQLALIYKVWWS